MPLDQVRLRAFLNGEAVPDEEDEVPQIRQQDVTAPGTSAPLARSGKLNTVGLRKMLNEKAVMQAVPNEEVEFSVLDSLARGSLNFGANVSSAFGAEDTADSLRQTAAENYAAATPDVMALEGVGDTASFFGERFLENMPNLGATGAAFLSGAAIGTAVGGPIGGAIGGAAGALTSVAVPMFGESRSGVIKATGEDQPFAAVPAAAVNTAIEFIPLGMVAKRLGILDPVKDAVREATEELGRDGLTVLKDATSSFLKVGATEAGVEVIQSYNNLVTQKLLNDESIFKLNAEDRHELINAAAGGAAAGGGMGAVSSVIGNRFARGGTEETPVETPTPTPEGTPAPAPEGTPTPPAAPSPIDELKAQIRERMAKIEGNDQILEDAANRANPDDGEFESELSTLFPTSANQQNVPGAKGTGPWTKRGHYHSEAKVFGEQQADGSRAGGRAQNFTILSEAKDSDGNIGTFPVPLTQANLRPGSVNVVRTRHTDRTEFGNPIAARIGVGVEGKDTEPSVQLLQGVQKELQTFMKELGLDMKLLIGEASDMRELFGMNLDSTSLGTATSIGDGTMALMLNYGQILRDPDTGTARRPESAQAEVLEVAFHEFGHVLFAHQWQTASSVQKKGLLQGYKEYMQESMTLPAKEFIAKYYPINRQKLFEGRREGKGLTFMEYLQNKSRTGKGGKKATKKGLEKVSYILNFDEYVANQFARRASRKTSSQQALSPEAEGFFAAALAKMRRLYRLIRSRTKTTATFDAYVDNLLLNTEVAKMIARQREMEGKAETETEESRALQGELEGKVETSTPAPAPEPTPEPRPPKEPSVVLRKRLKGNLTAAGIANRNLTRMEEKLETANMLYSDDRGRVTNGAMLETARARVETARRAVERKDGLIEATHRKWFDAGHTAEQWNAMVEEEFGHTDEYNWNQMVEGTDMETQGPLLDRAEDRIGSGIFRAIERHLGTGQTPVESVPEAAPAVAPPPAPPTPLDELKAQIRERMAKIEGNDQILEDAANRANPDDGEFESELSTLFPTAPHQANTPGQSGTGPWTKFNHNTSEAVAFGELMSNGKRTGGNAIFTNIFVEAKDAEGDTVTTVVPLKQENIRPGSVNVVASELQSTRFSDGMAGQIASPQGFGGRSDAMGLLQTVQRELQALMRDMGLDMKLLIGEDSTINALMGWNSTRGTALGFAGSINDGTMVIGLDLEAILSDPNSLYNRDKDSAQAQLLDSAFHEFGHTVFAHQWQTASSVQKKGLLQGYKEYMQESMTLPAQAFIAKYYPISKQQLLRGRKEGKGLTFMEYLSAKSKGDGITTTKKGLESVSYILNFDEYVANQFARRATRKTSSKQLLSPEAEGFFAAALAKLRRLYRLIRSRTKTTATFDAYVDNLLLNTEVAKMIARQREMEGKAETETEESRALQGELEEEGGTGERDTLSEGTRILDEAPEPNVIASVLDNIGLEEEATQLREHQSVQLGFVKIIKLLTPIQIAKMAKKSGILNPAAYMDLVRVFSNTKMKQVEIADEVVRKWKALGKDKAKRVSKMLFDASAKSDELGRRLTSEEEQALANQIDMSDEEFAAWREIDQSFRDILVEIERALILDAAKAYITDREQAKRFRDEYLATLDPAEQGRIIEFYTGQQLIPDDPNDPLVNALWTEMERIKGKMGVLRKKNYFPRSRLGQYTVTVTSNREGQTWEGTTSKRAKETLGFYAFDSSKARDQFLKFIQPDMATEDLNSAGSKMETEQFSFMGMPQVMLDQMLRKEKEAISENTNLTEMEKQIAIKAVETRFNDVSLALTPGRRFLQFMRKKRGVAGHSEDAIRAYSRYMSSASNHLARTEHARDLIETLNDMDAGIRQALQEGKGVILDDLVTLRDYYRKHFSYMMSPENDWAALRSVGFLWYLGLNVKSALVNLTQIPMVTYPKLAGTYGDKKAGVALGKAYWGITGHTIGKVQLTPDQLRMIDEMRSTGIIDESMVMELVGMGEADVLKRNIPGWDADNMLNKASYYGGAMFRWGEKYNRLVTALAAYNLARDSGMTHEQATVRTRKDIESSQFEYAKWNRPEFMRGKKSVLFLFWNYMQHVTFAFAGGEGKGTAKRMWLMSLMVAGLEGLPFAETILDLLDFGGTQMKKAVGSANPRVALREDMRDMLLEMTDKPDLFLNGLSSYYGLGPMHLATLLGAPVPNIDVSGSLGMGRPIPWMEPILGAAKNPDEKLGKITASVLGPVGAIPYQLYKSISSTDPDVWKRVEKTLPVFAKNAVQGTRWLATGEETFRGAGTFQEFQTPELRVAAAMKTLGFTSTVMSQKYNQIMATQEASVFWSLRKSMLLEDFHYALETGGREAVADARNAIKNHNKGMRETKGLRGLQITGSDLRQSVMQRKRSVRKRELGRPGSNKEIGLAREQQRRFPVVGE